MLQQFENAYLAVLRFLTLCTASLLLVGALLLGFSSLKTLLRQPARIRELPVVGTQYANGTLMWTVGTLKWNESVGQAPSPIFAGTSFTISDYAQASREIAKFAQAVGFGVNENQVEQVLARRASLLPLSLRPAYIAGLVQDLPQVLASSSIVLVTRKEKSFNATINGLLNAYTSRFLKETRAIKAQRFLKHQKRRQHRAAAVRRLYYAAAAFAAFLVLSLYFLLLRVERHLRLLEQLSRAPALDL